MNRSLTLLIAAIVAGCAVVNKEETGAGKTPADSARQKLYYENQFTVGKLSDSQLQAFQTRAIEKLKDFGDYALIISDASYDETLRQSAILQARDLFVDHSRINLTGRDMGVDFYLNELIRKSANVRLAFENAKIKSELKDAAGDMYEGKITFDLTTLEDSDTVSTATGKTADFYLMKTDKEFGRDRKLVWEIFLGNIY